MRSLSLVALLIFLTAPALGQDGLGAGLQRQSWDIFTRRNVADPLQTDVLFIDLLTGQQTAVVASGERFTLTDSGVIFFDTVEKRVKLVRSDGIIRDHPFIKITADGHRVDWAVSRDGAHIVWTISREVETDKLITATWLADVAGAEIRELLVYGPRAGIQLLPIDFGANRGEIFMEVHADGSENLSPYTRRTGLFSLLALEDELVTRALPGDLACFCAVGFGANLMLRLAPNPEMSGLDVEIYRLDGGEPKVIPALSRGNYSDAGNILLSADGKHAVYALSQIRESGEASDDIRSVLVHVDIENLRQRIAGGPIADLLRPLSFTDENRAVLITTQRGDATWKIDLAGGSVVEVAEAVYLGQLNAG